MFLVGIITFVSEFFDSALGMGYGTVLCPILIIMGNEPIKVVPAILISQLFTDIAACFCHHGCGNVNFNLKSADLKAALILGLTSMAGVLISVFVAIKIPKWLLTAYIGTLITAMGIFILFTVKKALPFSFRKLCAVSILAAFNKGISGGGYGPLIMGGQLISGVNTKSSIGITAFAEAITCLTGFILYIILGKIIDWRLVFTLIVFATLAVPTAAYTVKYVEGSRLKVWVGIFIIILGIVTVLRISG